MVALPPEKSAPNAEVRELRLGEAALGAPAELDGHGHARLHGELVGHVVAALDPDPDQLDAVHHLRVARTVGSGPPSPQQLAQICGFAFALATAIGVTEEVSASGAAVAPAVCADEVSPEERSASETPRMTAAATITSARNSSASNGVIVGLAMRLCYRV